MNSPTSTMLEPYWFFLLFAGMWLGVTGLLSHIAGWPALAKRFRSDQFTDGETFYFASGSIGSSTLFPVNFSSCLFFTVGNLGFRISILFPFRFLTPPLFIPWSEVQSITEKRLWLFRHAVIQIRGSSTKIMVPGRVGKCVTQTYAQYSSVHAL